MGTRWGGPLGPKGLPGGGGSSVMVFGGGAGIWNGAKRLGGKVAGAAVRTPGLGWIAAVLAGLGMIAFKWDDITSFMKAKMPTWWGLFSSLGSVIRGVGVEIGTVLSLTGARFAQWFTQIRDGYMRIIRWGWNFSTSLLQGMGEIGKGIANVMSWAARAARGSWTSTLGFIAAGWASFKAQNPLLAELVVGAKGAAGGLWNMVRPLSPSEILGGGKGKGQAMSAKLERGDYATILMGLSRASDPYTSDKAAYQKVNAARRYSDGFDSFSQTRMSAADVAAIRAAGLQLPFDPTAMPDFRKLAPNQISDLETSLGNFLSDNAAKTLLRDGALKDRGWWGLFQGAEAGLAEMLRLEGATVGAGAGLDPDRFADDMWTTGAAEQAISNGVKDGMVEAARIVSPYATEEYQHLWDQSVGQSYGKLYRDMSKQTLASTAVGMAAVQERGARGREENVRELARQTQAALDETRRVAQAVRDAGGDLVVDGQKLGRWVMNKLSTSKSDNKPRGVERGDALGAF